MHRGTERGALYLAGVLLCLGQLAAEPGPSPPVPEQTQWITDETVQVQAQQPQPTPRPPLPPPFRGPVAPAGGSPQDSAQSTRREDLRRVREGGEPEMLGDLPPLPIQVPFGPGSLVLPSVRSFKVADGESPRPQDRSFLTYNLFNNYYDSTNHRLNDAIQDIDIQRAVIGYEKAFCEGKSSVEFRLPIYTVSVKSTIDDLDGSHQAVGDLSLLYKQVLCETDDQDCLISGGMAITLPTGPASLFNSRVYARPHGTVLDPYLGYAIDVEDWHIHGFTSLQVPLYGDVALWFNDLGIRYSLFRNEDPQALLSLVAPKFELHVATPLNHVGILGSNDLVGMSHLVDFTAAVEFVFLNRAKLVLGAVVPVTGPSPVSMEFISEFRVLY